MSLSLEGTKALVLVLMLVLTLAASLLPLYFRDVLLRKLNQAGLSVCLCFGAGVLLSIVFLHLLPETQANFQYAMDVGFIHETSYPVAEVAVLSGFFFVYFMEEMIHAWVDHHTKVKEVQVISKGPKTVEEAQKQARERRLSSRRLSEVRVSTASRSTALGVAVIKEVNGYLNNTFEGDEEAAGHEKGGEGTSHSIHFHHRHEPATEGLSLMGTLVVVTALSFHGVMEGLAIGLEESTRDIWTLFAALCSHKVILAFSMSMELLQTGMKLKAFLVSIIIFSVASPIGGLIGALVEGLSTEETAGGLLAPTMLQAVSGGTILYVTFCEVLERERTKPMNGFLKFLALLLGFGLMAGLEAVGGHDHGHDHDHENTSSALCATALPTVPS